jgi:two-component sensor histidine kinase
MKLKYTKYLLPTTDGRLHKELSYLISLQENKMTKGKIKNRLDDLENKVKEMSHALSMMYNSIESTEQLFNSATTTN